ncbi:hypothetical protein HWV62_3018 [Athelia sp. TMB]|nr:hypothetical protein HWV62_3018 [Athelia sp. TMB]
MHTRNRSSRRGVVAPKVAGKKIVKSKGPAVVASSDDSNLGGGPDSNSNIQMAHTTKCGLEDEGNSDLKGDAPCTPSPSKSKVKPSNRAPRGVDAPNALKKAERPVVTGKKKSGIVFTDDEDNVADTMEAAYSDVEGPREVEGVTDDEEGDAVSADGERQSDVDFIDDSAVVDAGDETTSEVDYQDAEDATYQRSHSTHSAAGHAADAEARPMTPVNKELDRMHTEEWLFNSAQKKSLASIAATNPGDGTMRLYGEQTYIHDDVLDSPTMHRQRARAPVTPVKPNVHRQPIRVPDIPVKHKKPVAAPSEHAEEEFKYLSDLDPRGQQGPDRCQIENRDDMDPIISYTNLPNLLSGKRMESWSSVPELGLAVPSAWHEQIPGMSMSQLRNVIQFKKQGHMYNPSRMTPSDMGLAPHPGNSYIVPAGSTRAATLTTAILVTSSNLYRMKEVFGEDRHMISGIPHITEWQRMESAILMSFHLNSAHAQIAQQAITFSTSRTMSNVSTSPAKNPSRMFRQPANSSSSGGSPSAVAQSNVQGAGYVPILDGRHTRFSMQENLTSLDRILPPFNAEVPEAGHMV